MIAWTPHVYRDSATGETKSEPGIEHAASAGPDAMRVTLSPSMDRIQLVAMAPSWDRPYYTRSWEDREDARRVGEALLAHSARVGGLPRHNLYKVVDRLAAELALAAS